MTGRLVLRGGDIVDPEARTRTRGDVLVEGGRIAAVGDVGVADGAIPIDASGRLVSPGLVDLHTHVFVGQDLGVDPDEVGLHAGVTTVVDAGTAGGHTFGAFRRGVIEQTRTRVRAFVNISSIGATSILLAGELENLAYANEDVCLECLAEHRDVVVGVKIRASGNVVGANGRVPLDRSRHVADRVGLPLMVHLGPAPPTNREILAELHAGDIITHCCTGFADNRLAPDGRVLDEALAAQQRGVIFDIGHGMSGFSAESAAAMIAGGLVPDTVSTDVHSYSRQAVVDLPTVMSRLVALGMPVDDVIRAATCVPARHAGLLDSGVGTLRVGAPADIAVLDEVVEPVRYVDPFGAAYEGDRRLEAVVTIKDGIVVSDRRAI